MSNKTLTGLIVQLSDMLDDKDDEIEMLQSRIDALNEELENLDDEYDEMVKSFTIQVNDLRAEAIKAKEYIERMKGK